MIRFKLEVYPSGVAEVELEVNGRYFRKESMLTYPESKQSSISTRRGSESLMSQMEDHVNVDNMDACMDTVIAIDKLTAQLLIHYKEFIQTFGVPGYKEGQP
ncbi:hypothetical protein EOM33_03215 [Candidatus Saccharibacteria bacterium]|nr:hypothetical protein [Candidatus Saccharibacteria bacterium]